MTNEAKPRGPPIAWRPTTWEDLRLLVPAAATEWRYHDDHSAATGGWRH